jgi:ATP-dependent RNA helicase DeaD
VLVVGATDRRRAERFAFRAGLDLTWTDAPGSAELVARDHDRMLKDPVLLGAEPAEHDGLVARLVAAHSPEVLARAYARLWRALRPVLPI